MHKRPTRNPATAAKTARPKPAATSPDWTITAEVAAAEDIPTRAARVKSEIREMLLASPYFPRLYADVVISSAPNSNEAKILAHNYQKIVDMTNRDVRNRSNMPVQPSVKICTHIKVTGVRCGSPALRGEQFCYFHQRVVRGVSTPPKSRLHPIAIIENEEAIQSSLMEVINALVRNTIDLKRAELVLRALHIAVRNVRRVQFGVHKAEMVREVPNYPDPPKSAVPQVHESAVEQNPKPLTTHSALAMAMLHSADPDPTERKPPARAGLPTEKKSVALPKGG